MNNLTIRPLDPEKDDLAAVLDLILSAFAYMEGVIDPPSSARLLTVETLRAKAFEETGYMVTQQNRPVACLFAREEAPDTLYIGKFAVHPDWQGKGLGRLLMAQAETHARARSLMRLRLETRVELLANHATFRHFGFEKTAENRHAGYDRPTSIEMVKAIAPLD